MKALVFSWRKLVKRGRERGVGRVGPQVVDFQFLRFCGLPAFSGPIVIWRRVGPHAVVFPIARSWSAGFAFSKSSRNECGRAIAGVVRAALQCIHLYTRRASGIRVDFLGQSWNIRTGFPRRARRTRRRKGFWGDRLFVWKGKWERGKRGRRIGRREEKFV
jgi:hypothetical protein